MSEYDCLLLEFVFGQRPDDAHKVKAYVLEQIAADSELQKTEILFLGSFGRACEFLSAGDAEVGFLQSACFVACWCCRRVGPTTDASRAICIRISTAAGGAGMLIY